MFSTYSIAEMTSINPSFIILLKEMSKQFSVLLTFNISLNSKIPFIPILFRNDPSMHPSDKDTTDWFFLRALNILFPPFYEIPVDDKFRVKIDFDLFIACISIVTP